MRFAIFQFYTQLNSFLIEGSNKRSKRNNFISRHIFFLSCRHHVQISLAQHIQCSFESWHLYYAFSPFNECLAVIWRFYDQIQVVCTPISSCDWSSSSKSWRRRAVELNKTPPLEIWTDLKRLGMEISMFRRGWDMYVDGNVDIAQQNCHCWLDEKEIKITRSKWRIHAFVNELSP